MTAIPSGHDGEADAASRVPPPVGSAVEGYGWLAFAAIVLTFAGAFNVLDGIVGLTRESFFRPGAHYIFGDLHTWAWILIIAGALQVIAGAALGTGSELARWYGIAAACVNALVQLLVIQEYPFWSLAVFALDMLAVYALAVHAGSRLAVGRQ